MNIHLRIKEIAEKKNITQDEIGLALGVTGKTAHNYLNGHTKISIEQLSVISKTLRVSIDQIFQEVGAPLQKHLLVEEKLNAVEEPGICFKCLEKEAEINKWKDKYIYLLETGHVKKENSSASDQKVG